MSKRCAATSSRCNNDSTTALLSDAVNSCPFIATQDGAGGAIVKYEKQGCIVNAYKVAIVDGTNTAPL